jgi:glycosyltransferase involved in cell wall biosynthesis
LELEYDFNYLAVGQWGPRKNLDNLIRWWLEECWDQEVGLVIKTSHRRNNIMDREYTKNRLKYVTDSLELDKEDRKCKVYLLHGDLTEAEMSALYHHPKISCMATTTHGEGFGLPLFEFAQVGKPIIAPEWSGHLDFLVKDKTSCFLPVNYDIQQVQKEAVWDGVIQADSMWAFPHEGSFKQRVRQVRKGGKWPRRAKQIQEWVLQEFDPDKQHNFFADTIAAGQFTDGDDWLNEIGEIIKEYE